MSSLKAVESEKHAAVIVTCENFYDVTGSELVRTSNKRYKHNLFLIFKKLYGFTNFKTFYDEMHDCNEYLGSHNSNNEWECICGRENVKNGGLIRHKILNRNWQFRIGSACLKHFGFKPSRVCYLCMTPLHGKKKSDRCVKCEMLEGDMWRGRDEIFKEFNVTHPLLKYWMAFKRPLECRTCKVIEGNIKEHFNKI